MKQKVAYKIFSETLNLLKKNFKNYTIRLSNRQNKFSVEITIYHGSGASKFFVITDKQNKEKILIDIIKTKNIKKTPLAIFSDSLTKALNKEAYILDGNETFTIKSISEEDGVYMCLLSDGNKYSVYDLSIKEN